MLNIIWMVFALSFGFLLLRWRSPLLLIIPSLVLASIISPFSEGDVALINLIMVGWSMVLITAAAYMRIRGIAIGSIAEVSADHSRITRKSLWVLVFAVGFLVVAFVIWIAQAGIVEVGSRKRVSDAGPFFHILNVLFGLYTFHAIIVFSFLRFRLSNPHVLMAIGTFVLLLVVGYLASRRSIVIAPALAITLIQVARMRSLKGQLKIFLTVAIVAPCLVIFMALVSSERAGSTGVRAGLEVLSEQVTQEVGYGFSPGKDRIVWQFSEYRTAPEMRVVLFGGFYGAIPRVFWGGKPEWAASGPIAGAYVFRERYWVDVGAGIPISFPAELALAFGNGWFFVGLVASLLLMVSVAEMARRFPFLLLPSMFFYAGLISDGLPKSQMGFVVGVISMLVLSYFLGVRLVDLRKDAGFLERRSWVGRRGLGTH